LYFFSLDLCFVPAAADDSASSLLFDDHGKEIRHGGRKTISKSSIFYLLSCTKEKRANVKRERESDEQGSNFFHFGTEIALGKAPVAKLVT
jgi:hypothetical protein